MGKRFRVDPTQTVRLSGQPPNSLHTRCRCRGNRHPALSVTTACAEEGCADMEWGRPGGNRMGYRREGGGERGSGRCPTI